MPDIDPDMDEDLDPDDLDPAAEELEELEKAAEADKDLDDFGEPPNHGAADDEQFGRLHH